MIGRRKFLGQCVGTAAVLTATAIAAKADSSAPDEKTSEYDGIMGRGYARGPHGLVHFHDSGGLVQPRSGQLPLFLLHQSPASARQFEAAFEPLVKRGIRFIAVDTPGFGFSDPTDFVPKIGDWASSIVAVMDHLGFEQVDLLGHHTGALLGTEVALQAPNRVRNLILNGPFPITEEEREKYIAGSEKSHARGEPKLDGSHLKNSFDLRVTMYGPNPDPKVITRIVVEKYQGLGSYTWGHHAAYRYDHATTIKQIRQRTLILTNTGDGIYEMAQRARKLRPDFDYFELEGGTQDIVDQQPEAWSDAVVSFLRSAT